MSRNYYKPPRYEPTPAMIREQCAAIQATWSEQDERVRRVIKNRSWLPPGVERPLGRIAGEPVATEAGSGGGNI